MWDTPNPPLIQQLDFWSEAPLNSDFSRLQMRYVSLQNISGLTVCVTMSGAVAISNGTVLEYEPERHAHSVYLYFPLIHNEVILSIWVRSCATICGSGTLVVSFLAS